MKSVENVTSEKKASQIDFCVTHLSNSDRENIQITARENAMSRGLTAEWENSRKNKGLVADILMAFDPDGELCKEPKQDK